MVGIGARYLDHRFWGIRLRSVSIPFARKWLKSSLEKLSEKSSRRCGVTLRDVEKAHFSARLVLHIPAKFTVVGSSYPFSTVSFGEFPSGHFGG